jgi:hypothetical protein
MNKKQPKTFVYQDIMDILEYDFLSRMDEFNALSDYDGFFKGEMQVVRKRREIYRFLSENQDKLITLEQLLLEYLRVIELNFPTVYPVIVKANGDLNDRAYVNARVFWPMPNRNKKELRFYICPYSEDIDINSMNFRKMMNTKVVKELKKRSKLNFFKKLDDDEKDKLLDNT